MVEVLQFCYLGSPPELILMTGSGLMIDQVLSGFSKRYRSKEQIKK